MAGKMMEDTLRIERKVIKHDDFRFWIEDPCGNDLDYSVHMKGFSIETRIYFQEWVGLLDSGIEPNRFIKILEGPYSFVDYRSPYNDIQYADVDRHIESFEKGLSPACMKYNYHPIPSKDFQRIITKHAIETERER